jgi:hypothetical protein
VTFGFLFLPGMRGPEREALYRPRHARWSGHAEPRRAEPELVRA